MENIEKTVKNIILKKKIKKAKNEKTILFKS